MTGKVMVKANAIFIPDVARRQWHLVIPRSDGRESSQHFAE
jgi:hypothetical protein